MNIKDFETLGFYEPGFLHLRVNTDENIFDLNEMATNPDKAKLFSTFLHEYIHFLQDVSTPSGLMSAHFYIDFIKDANWTIRHDGNDTFEIPIEISNVNNVEANFKLREIYRGEVDGSSFAKYDGYTIEEEAIINKDGNTVKPPKYKVHYYDLYTREAKNFYFGFGCLKEYMAHAIQKKYFPDVEHPDIPYQITEQIIAKEYPEFGTDAMMIVALCDASLMSFHPSQMFFNTIERMKKGKFIPKTPKEVYEYAFHDLKFHGEIGTETVYTLFEKTVELTKEQFFDALQSPQFISNYKWVEHILFQARDIRLNQPTFITELVEGGGKLSRLFFNIFHKLGSPFFTNKTEKGGFVPPGNLTTIPEQPYQLLVFKQLINLYSGHIPCKLYKFCKTRQDKDITNEHCKTSPWMRAKEGDLCPFGQLWKTWGLLNKIPVLKK